MDKNLKEMDKNRDAYHAYVRAYYQKRKAEDPGYLAARNAYARKYYAEHKEAHMASTVRYWVNRLRELGYTVIEPEGGAE